MGLQTSSFADLDYEYNVICIFRLFVLFLLCFLIGHFCLFLVASLASMCINSHLEQLEEFGSD